MPAQAKGEIRFSSGVWVARITLRGRDRVSLPLPTCSTEAEARERAALLAQLAQRLRGAPSITPERARKALEFVGEATARSLASSIEAVGDLIGGKLELKGAPKLPTFGELGAQWTSGELAKRYPDQIRVKRSVADDRSRLANYIYPVLKDTPIDRVTLDQCEEVMRRLPEDLKPATRHRIGTLVSRILSLAVYPLRLIERSPIPRGFLPAQRRSKALAYLYPDEDRRLLGCAAVPFAYRLLWGFLAREGMRLSESIGLTWGDVDLERGAVRLDKTKTDDARAWALDPGVVAALRVYRERYRAAAGQGDRVFTSPTGRPLDKYGMADLLRSHLVEVGLHRERPELFTTTAERQRIRVHDLRGTFVTVNLANGRSESWISDRTGHRSSQMISAYKRTARTFAELHMGTLASLVEALPELAMSPGCPQKSGPVSEEASKSAESLSHLRELNPGPTVYECEPTATQARETAEIPANDAIDDRSEARLIDPVGQSVGNADPVETALATALQGATAAGQWEVVATLARELEARRTARAGTIDLAAERRRRGQQ